MQPTKRGSSFDDLGRVPPETAAELLDGELYLRPTQRDHEHLWEALCANYLQEAWPNSALCAWYPVSAPQLELGRDVLRPESCAWTSPV